VKIHDIKIGKRWRDDYGDLEGLADSIKRHGLLSPITVSPSGELLAGGRRLKAAQLAGLSEIPTWTVECLTEGDQRLVELEENIQRKDLTWQEEISLKAEIDRLLKLKDPKHTQKSTATHFFGETPANFSRDLELAKAVSVFDELKQCDNKHQAARLYKKLKEDGAWALTLSNWKCSRKASFNQISYDQPHRV